MCVYTAAAAAAAKSLQSCLTLCNPIDPLLHTHTHTYTQFLINISWLDKYLL